MSFLSQIEIIATDFSITSAEFSLLRFVLTGSLAAWVRCVDGGLDIRFLGERNIDVLNEQHFRDPNGDCSPWIPFDGRV